MADDYLAAATLPPLRLKLVLEQACSGCARKLWIPLLPAGYPVICPHCGVRHTGQANLNEPLPLQEASGLFGISIPAEWTSLTLGQVLTMFEERLNAEYRSIFQLFQMGGATIVRGRQGNAPPE